MKTPTQYVDPSPTRYKNKHSFSKFFDLEMARICHKFLQVRGAVPEQTCLFVLVFLCGIRVFWSITNPGFQAVNSAKSSDSLGIRTIRS